MDVPGRLGGYPFSTNSETSRKDLNDSSYCDIKRGSKASGLIPIHGTNVGRCRCKCAHASLQKRLTLATFLISVIAVLVGIYAVCTNRSTLGHESCGLSDEDRHLLQELRSLKSMIVQNHVEEVDPMEVPESVPSPDYGLLSLKHLVKRDSENGLTDNPSENHTGRNGKKRNGRHKKNRKNRKPKKPKKTRKNKRKVMRAAHYVPLFWNDRNVDEYKANERCINVEKWGGQACRNRTLKMTKGPIRFLHEAEWLHKSSNILSPATQYENGTFEILDSGLYLLYSSVLFYDSKKKQSQAIVKNGNRLFKCMEGVDYISDDGSGKPYNSKYKTCSVTGVTYLKKGDLLAVGNLYDNTIIDMSEDSTFFGIVQLIPGK